MMLLRFKEERATQAAGYFLKRGGGSMSYMKLIKLLYFADRRALLELGRPITYDQWVMMKHGPVLSRIYDLAAAEPDPEDASYWHRFIAARDRYDVKLIAETSTGDLSSAEEEILASVFDEWGSRTRWEVRDASHDFPEFRPTTSSIRIDYRDILLLEGRTEAEADEICGDLEAEEFLSTLATEPSEDQEPIRAG